MFVAFIHLKKAYDRVNRVKLWEALRQTTWSVRHSEGGGELF